MPKPFRNRVQKQPFAVALIEWVPRCRPNRDFEGFDDLEAMHEFFEVWREDSEDDDHPVVVAEVLDTATMTLGRVASFGDDGARRARLIEAKPTRLIAKRTAKAKANISWVTDSLATGGDFSFLDDVMLEQLDHLLAQRVGLVVDCRLEESDHGLWQEVAHAEEASPTYVHLPTADAEGWNIPPEHFDAAVSAVGAHMDRGQRVFVHCHMGVNRGPSTAYAVLLAKGHGITEAFDLIRAARPVAGIAYAEDALSWWARRQQWSRSRTEAALAQLGAHIDAVLGPKDTRVIEHAMRKMAGIDERESAEIQW